MCHKAPLVVKGAIHIMLRCNWKLQSMLLSIELEIAKKRLDLEFFCYGHSLNYRLVLAVNVTYV